MWDLDHKNKGLREGRELHYKEHDGGGGNKGILVIKKGMVLEQRVREEGLSILQMQCQM